MAINHSIHGFFELGINQLDHPNRMNHLTGSSGTFKECWFDPPNSGEGNTWKNMFLCFFEKKEALKNMLKTQWKPLIHKVQTQFQKQNIIFFTKK